MKSFVIMSYTVGHLIGQGSHGHVFEARDAQGAVYAVKISAISSERQKKRLQRESRIHAHLTHPHIVKYLESFEHDNSYHVVMERVYGTELSVAIRKSKHFMEEFDVINIFKQIVDAVLYMHDKRIIHRDLKSSNILLTNDFTVKLVDLGTAVELPESGYVKLAFPVGTPGYMAPEARDCGNVDEKCDVFSLGCILFEMVSLKKPGTDIEKFVAGFRNMIPQNYTPALIDMISSMLVLSPEKRPTLREIAKCPLIKYTNTNRSCDIFTIEIDTDDDKGYGNAQEVVKRIRVCAEMSCASIGKRVDAGVLKRIKKEAKLAVGRKMFRDLKYHAMNEFDDLNSADFINEIEEQNPDYVIMIREYLALEEMVK